MTLPPIISIDVDSFYAVVNYTIWVNLPLNSVILVMHFSFLQTNFMQSFERSPSEVS